MPQSPPAPILTARMLNEFVYCPRLFYYEQVEGVFQHNADTLQGSAVHRRVGAREDSLPDAAEAPAAEVIHARSISLFSERLGVTAKLDLVEILPEDICGELSPREGHALCAQPVEYKKGRPREGEDGNLLWDADKMQLGLQILLLRDNGYACDGGIVYYRETRQRVSFLLDAETEVWILAQVGAARQSMSRPIPPPLEHSPKCPRCSLVGICLPDETRMLSAPRNYLAPPEPQLDLDFPPEPDDSPPQELPHSPFDSIPEIKLPPLRADPDLRRLIAPNPESRALYIHSPGVYVSKTGETLTIKEDGKVIAEYRFLDLHHVALMGSIQMSTQAIQALCEEDIPITYLSSGGWFYGMTRGHSLKNVLTRIEQFRIAADPEQSLRHARTFIYGKIRNQRTLLMRNHTEPSKPLLISLRNFANSSLLAPTHNALLGTEGSAANLYFSHFTGLLKPAPDLVDERQNKLTPPDATFAFTERNRRPPRDPVNALLSLTYSLLVKDCTLACYAVGFDPYIGFLHQPRHGKPALALDLMEEFRPLVADSTVITLINNQMLTPADFLYAGKTVALQHAGRKKVFQAYEKRMNDHITHPLFNYKVSYRRAIELQARLLAKAVTGEIEQYIPFLTR